MSPRQWWDAWIAQLPHSRRRWPGAPSDFVPLEMLLHVPAKAFDALAQYVKPTFILAEVMPITEGSDVTVAVEALAYGEDRRWRNKYATEFFVNGDFAGGLTGTLRETHEFLRHPPLPAGLLLKAAVARHG